MIGITKLSALPILFLQLSSTVANIPPSGPVAAKQPGGCFQKDLIDQGAVIKKSDNIYRTQGSCQVECGPGVAMAVNQLSCLCIKAMLDLSKAVDAAKCDQFCAGYPSENCGSQDGNYFRVYEKIDSVYDGGKPTTGAVITPISPSNTSSTHLPSQPTGYFSANVTVGANITLTVTDPKSILSASKSLVKTLLDMLQAGGASVLAGEITKNVLSGKNASGTVVETKSSLSWVGGAVYGSLIDYFKFSGDATVVDITVKALETQIGPGKNFQPKDTNMLCNDDIAIWAIAAISAEEAGIPCPKTQSSNYWREAAINAAQSLNDRWDTKTCKGGIRWMVNSGVKGYTQKFAITQGLFMHLCAKLYVVTNNSMYLDWVKKAYDFLTSSGLLTKDGKVFGGIDGDSCEVKDKSQWSLASGTVMGALSIMWNKTSDATYKTQVESMVPVVIQTFTKDNIVYEAACEEGNTCSQDQMAYKGLFAHYLGETMRYCQTGQKEILKVLETTATAAITTCTATEGTISGLCKFCYTPSGKGNDKAGLGFSQQIGVLGFVQDMLPVMPSNSTLHGVGSSTPYGVKASPSAASEGVALAWGIMGGLLILTFVVGGYL